MKTLALILTLANGETGRMPMPAWECRAIQAEMEHAWSIGGHVDREDGIRVTAAECVQPSFVESLSASAGDCEMEPEA